jgi:hypothetical protein
VGRFPNVDTVRPSTLICTVWCVQCGNTNTKVGASKQASCCYFFFKSYILLYKAAKELLLLLLFFFVLRSSIYLLNTTFKPMLESRREPVADGKIREYRKRGVSVCLPKSRNPTLDRSIMTVSVMRMLVPSCCCCIPAAPASTCVIPQHRILSFFHPRGPIYLSILSHS